MHRHRAISSLFLLSVALLIPAAAQQPQVVPITSEKNHQLTITNDYARIFKVEVPPKTETLYHQHEYDYLYIVIGDADVVSTNLDQKPVSAKLRDGSVGFSKGGFAHKAFNN